MRVSRTGSTLDPMPTAPPKWCNRCRIAHAEACQPTKLANWLHSDHHRGTAAQRGYDHRWAKLRTAFIGGHTLCAHCLILDRVSLAAEVDHIRPLAQGGARLDPDNLQALCRSCHSLKTATDRRNCTENGQTRT